MKKVRNSSRGKSIAVWVVAVLAAFACGGSSDGVIAGTAAGQECHPADPNSFAQEGPADDMRGEALVEYLTGIDEQATQEDREIVYDNPGYGGVWGDFNGGWVVAVLDCSQVDLDEITRLGGGPDLVTIIEVEHTFEQINEFRDRLAAELLRNGIRGEVPIDSTLTGRFITVRVEDSDSLPDDFGSDVPPTTFSIEEGVLSQPNDG